MNMNLATSSAGMYRSSSTVEDLLMRVKMMHLQVSCTSGKPSSMSQRPRALIGGDTLLAEHWWQFLHAKKRGFRSPDAISITFRHRGDIFVVAG